MQIRAATPSDASAILAIYAPFVRDTAITFEDDVPTLQDMENRITGILENHAYLVAVEDDQVVGYAYGSPFKPRSAYRFTAEVSVYIAPSHHGRGIARALYEALIAALHDRGMHTLVAIVALPNPASDALHRTCGFSKTGELHNVGYKMGGWHDVAFYEKHLT